MSSPAGVAVKDCARRLLRHTIATLAYRGGKALRGASASFGDFQVAPQTRTPREILAHIGDLLDWAVSIARGRQEWHDSAPLPWDAEVRRFYSALAALDTLVGSDEELCEPVEKLFQGPIADAFTHVGQIAMLRRLAGAPVRGENYHKAQIEAGRVGPSQAAPVREFD